LANALLGLPPVAVGVVLYVLLSRSGPLGRLGLLGALVKAGPPIVLMVVALAMLENR
jgi:tungstate transport system permease protein